TCAVGVLGDDALSKPLLCRIRKHTNIKKFSYDGVDRVHQAHYAILGVKAGERSLRGAFASSPAAVDAILLNALQRRCETLGRNWSGRIAEVLAASRDRFGSALPVLAVTDDSWIQHVLAKEVLPKHSLRGESVRIPKPTVLMEPARIYEVRRPFRAT